MANSLNKKNVVSCLCRYSTYYYCYGYISWLFSVFECCKSVLQLTSHCLADPRPGHPLHPEEHQEEPWCEGLALVEGLHYRAASDPSAAQRGADPWQRRMLLFIYKPHPLNQMQVLSVL